VLRNGADPHLRATFRKQLRDMGDGEKEQMREYRDVTAVGSQGSSKNQGG